MTRFFFKKKKISKNDYGCPCKKDVNTTETISQKKIKEEKDIFKNLEHNPNISLSTLELEGKWLSIYMK